MEKRLEGDIVHDHSKENAKKLGCLELFLAKCSEMIKSVDDSTAVLMRSLDAILLAIQMHGQQLDVHLQNTDGNTREVIENIKACRETSNQGIKVMQAQLLHQQKSTVDTLSKFLHFVVDTFKEQGTDVFIFAKNLMIDRYRNESDLPKVISKDNYTLEYLLMENKELRETVNELKDRIDVLYEKEQTFLKQEKIQNKKIRMMQSTVSSFETDNKKMKSEIMDVEKLYEDEIRKNKDQVMLYEDEIQKHKGQMTDMYNQIRTIKKENFKLKEEVENGSKVQIVLEEELNILKSKRVIQVQLYSQKRTSLTSFVEQELTGLLKRKMESDKLELEFVQCVKSSDIQSDLPVLMCITVSRIGTDVANFMHGLDLNQKTAALVFHHKEVHALPNQASERVLTDQQLRNLGGVFDLAFLSDKGIYDCEMNNYNVISLINFVNREGMRRVKYNA